MGSFASYDLWNDDNTERVVRRFALMPDVSAVTYPANPGTSITARTAAEAARAEEARGARKRRRAKARLEQLRHKYPKGTR